MKRLLNAWQLQVDHTKMAVYFDNILDEGYRNVGKDNKYTNHTGKSLSKDNVFLVTSTI
jgi:hypothetical protein